MQWDSKKEGRAALQSHGGNVLVRGCEFQEDKAQFEIGEGTRKAIFSQNIIKGKLRVTNAIAGKASINDNAAD
jgi:hypothetical protein